MAAYSVQRYNTPITVLNGGTTASVSTNLNGLLRGVQVNAPDLDSTNTYTVTITDQDGYTTYTKASIAENSRYTAFIDANNQPLQLPLTGTYGVAITTSGAQAAGRAFSVTLLVQR
jgi:hypothetical protein